MTPPRPITRFYFMIPVEDMTRAVTFYTRALGTELRHSSAALSEVHLGDVTVCLKAGSVSPNRSTGLMIEVADLAAAAAAVVDAGGRLLGDAPGTGPAPLEGPLEATDTEGNVFTLVPGPATPSASSGSP